MGPDQVVYHRYPPPPGAHGIVEQVFDEEGYGFLRVLGDERQVYFHRNSVLHGDFGRLAVGTEVRFTPQEGDDGPQASSVQLVAKL